MELVADAICAGIFNDLGSGSNVDLCIITKSGTEYKRNYKRPNLQVPVPSYGSEPLECSVPWWTSSILGSLPIVGLVSRILSDEGGVGTDRLRFVEFCTKVEKKMTYEGSRAFYAFTERHGKVAKTQYVMMWCWAAAVGAGMLKSEDFLMGAARLRVSHDIQFETETFDLLMDAATKRRAKSKAPAPVVPMVARVEKALQGICKCCVGTDQLSEEDAVLITALLHAVFPTVELGEIEQLVRARLAESVESSEHGMP